MNKSQPETSCGVVAAQERQEPLDLPKFLTEPVRPWVYTCPARCGCLWRDNGDGTMSLFGPRSQSCAVCEPLPLDKLLPLYRRYGYTSPAPAAQQDELLRECRGVINWACMQMDYMPDEVAELMVKLDAALSAARPAGEPG